MPALRVNGIRLFYEEARPSDPGAEPLLLIMGWGGDHTAWAFQVPAFSSEFRVVSPDNRGAGQSEQPDTPYSIAGMAADMVGLLDALGIQQAHLCGASMGGMIAQEIALGYPDRVRTLQLHCTMARPDPYGAMLVQSLLGIRARGGVEEHVRAILPWVLCRKTVAERPDFVSLLLDRAVGHPHPTSLVGLTRQAEAIRAHDTLERLGSLDIPTLITVGVEDILVPPRFSQEIHERIPGSQLVLVPDAGHLHFMERPDVFNETCLDFLRGVRSTDVRSSRAGAG